MFFIVAGDKIYKETKNDDEKYPLVKISISADNAVTVTEEDEGVEAFPKNYYRASIKEVIAMFGITSESGYKPPATIIGDDPVLIYLDEEEKVVTITLSNPSEGNFSEVASSDTNVATVLETNGVFTIAPVAEGVCLVTAKWTPTDLNFAPSVVRIPVAVIKRKIEFTPVRNQSLTKGVNKTITIKSNVASGASLNYTVLSTDTGICSPAMDVTQGKENDLILTVADNTPLGSTVITLSAVDDNEKAYDSEVMKFKVRVCESGVTVTPISDQEVEEGGSKEVTVTTIPGGTTIREAVSSDPSKVTVEIVNKLKVRVTAVGAVGENADITVYCDKRGYGEGKDTFKVTIVE